MGITMQCCVKCAKSAFPPRSLCPHCHGSAFVPVTAYRGVIEETSLQRGTPGTLYASIRTDLGPIVIARILGDGGVPGTEVELAPATTYRTDGLVALIPQPTTKE